MKSSKLFKPIHEAPKTPADKMVVASRKRLDAMEHDTELDKFRDELTVSREEALAQLISTKNSTRKEQQKKQLEAFDRRLKQGTQLLEQLAAFKKNINRLTHDERSKQSDPKKTHTATQPLLTAASDVFKKSSGLVISTLREGKCLDRVGTVKIRLISNVVKHSDELIQAPSSSKAKALLDDQKKIAPYLKDPRWRTFAGAVALLAGSCLLAVGLGAFFTPAAPLGILIITLAADVMMAGYGLVTTNPPEEKKQVEDSAAQQIEVVVGQSGALFLKIGEDIPLVEPESPVVTRRQHKRS